MSLKKNVFSLQEILQGTIGSFTAVLLFFALRGGQPFSFNPKHGLLITILLLLVYYKGFKMQDKTANFISNFAIAFVVSALMAVTFGIVSSPEIFTYGVFGTPVIIGVWLGFPTALLFDKYDFTNPLKRQYVRK